MKKVLSFTLVIALLLGVFPVFAPPPALAQGLEPIFISDMHWLEATWGIEGANDPQWKVDYPIGRDVNLGGSSIVLGGITYSKGVGTAPFDDNSTPADIVVAIPDTRYNEFYAVAGVDDVMNGQPGGTVVFEVLADGVVVATTPILTTADAYELKVNITGANELRLRVWNGGDGWLNDWAVWADAQIRSTESYLASGIITDYGSNLPWSLSVDGTLNLHGGPGSFINWTNHWENPWAAHSANINKIVFTGQVTGVNSLVGLFRRLNNVTAIEGLHYFDTSKVTDMSWLFDGIGNRNPISLDLSALDTSNVQNMSSMFFGVNITDLDLSVLNTASVTNMNLMFSGAKSLTGLNLSDWDVSNAQDMSSMFSNADIPSLDLSWRDTGSLETTNFMFGGGMGYFGHITSIAGLSGWDTSSLKDMRYMFNNLRSITSLDLSGWDVRNVEYMNNVFGVYETGGASNLVSLNLSGWDTRGLNASIMSNFLSYLPSLRHLVLGENFEFHYIHGIPGHMGPGTPSVNAGLPEPLQNATYTGVWVAVGNGTICTPEEPAVVPFRPAMGLTWRNTASSYTLMMDDPVGSSYVGGKTWVWQRVNPGHTADDYCDCVPMGFLFAGQGTDADPFIITNATELALMAQLVNEGNTTYNAAHYRLDADLDLSDYGVNFNGGKGWIPIGNSSSMFSGILDGNKKIISGLYINDPSAHNTGLFGTILNGTVKDLTIINGSVIAANNVGGLAGSNLQGIITNFSFTGTVSGGTRVAGIVGNSSATITNSHTKGSVSGGSSLGGLVGSNEGTISNSYSTASVLNGYGIGGLVGWNNGMVKNSYSTGAVSGGSSVGGIVGTNSLGTVENCYSTGTVTGSSYQVGGITGLNSAIGIITNCYATGSVHSNSYWVGGIIGRNLGSVTNSAALNLSVTTFDTLAYGRVAGFSSGTMSNNVAFSDMIITRNGVQKTPLDKGLGAIDGEDITAASINADGTIGGRFTTANGWTIQNGKLPSFGTAFDMPTHIPHMTSLAGQGTEADPYLIHNAAELALMAELVNTPTVPNPSTHNWNEYFRAHYKLINDIDLPDYGVNFNGGKGWIPIGGNNFGGVFDGNNKTISGLYINDPSTNALGLFASMYGGLVKDLTITNAFITGNDYIGGIVGLKFQGEIENCIFIGSVNGNEAVGGIAGSSSRSIKNSNTSGSVTGYKFVGGISGGNGGNTENCSSTSTVTGTGAGNSDIGGLIGNNSGTMKNSYFTGEVTGANNIGGLTGSNSSNIMDSYNTGTASGISVVGGVAGYNSQYGTVKTSYSTGTVGGNRAGGVVGWNDGGLVQKCYSRGTITGHQIGGIVGKSDWGTIVNCYSISAINGQGGDIGGIVGWNNGGTVVSCAALNPNVTTDSDWLGRIAGVNDIVTSHIQSPLYNNVAFSGMTVIGNNVPKTLIKGHDKIDGEDITAAVIRADGTIGGLFTTADGWTIQNGKLPGFGAAVDMPAYINDGFPIPAPIRAVNVPSSNLPIGVWVNSSITSSITPGRWHSGIGLSQMNPQFETTVMNFEPGTHYYLLAPAGRWSIDSSCMVIVVTVSADGSVTAEGHNIFWNGTLVPVTSDPVQVVWKDSAWNVSWG